MAMLLLVPAVAALCPAIGIPPNGHPIIPGQPQDLRSYRRALAALDFFAVKEDIKARLTDSDSQWPADWGNYGRCPQQIGSQWPPRCGPALPLL